MKKGYEEARREQSREEQSREEGMMGWAGRGSVDVVLHEFHEAAGIGLGVYCRDQRHFLREALQRRKKKEKKKEKEKEKEKENERVRVRV